MFQYNNHWKSDYCIETFTSVLTLPPAAAPEVKCSFLPAERITNTHTKWCMQTCKTSVPKIVTSDREETNAAKDMASVAGRLQHYLLKMIHR
jgi:hypothetical protein